MAIPTVSGFRFAGVAAGIKKKGGADVGLIVADAPAAAAAVFTGNRVKAAPVLVSAAHLRASRGRAQAVIVNAGNANACTGPRGLADARAMAKQTAGVLGLRPHDVLVCSTGVIGQPLPMAKVSAGIDAAAAALGPDRFGDFAAAILTTDRGVKLAHRTVKLGRATATLVGCTKGAGMIAPNMATTLTFVATDAAVTPAVLARLTRAAVAPTFNAAIVDGDTSTNDTLAVLASGAGPTIAAAALPRFGAALTELLADLAGQLMRDGEGVHHVVTIAVTGARSERDATAVARRIAVSPLVKTAIAGGDPNWGRVLCAVGNAGVTLDPDRLRLSIGGVPIVRKGAAVPSYDEPAAAAAMRAPAYTIAVDLGAGKARAQVLACDLSHEYVSINADYRS